MFKYCSHVNTEVKLMSEIINKYVTCPKCRQQSTSELMCSVNTESEPEIRESVFDESFFRWKCVKCGFQTKLLHPLLYNDIKNKFMVYYIPNVKRSQIVDEKLEKEFSDLSHIKKRVVPSINSMKEKIFLFEKKYNDMAVELSKLAVSEVVAKSTGQSVYEGYCTEIDKSSNTISFQFFIGGEHRSYLQTTRYDVYNRSLSIVKEHFADVKKKRGFLNIDRSWAKEALRRYKNLG